MAILQSAGFDVTGLEISPWVVQFIRDTFQVPVLLGPVEDQQIEPESLDVIALMDVFEHLPDPVRTMRHCLRLLRPDGILIIQTPRYPEGACHEEMVAQRDRFLEALKPTDHLYLFSRQAIRKFFGEVGAGYVFFETALFGEYDMFVVVSRVPPVIFGPAEIEVALSARPASRMIQSLLDLDADRSVLNRRYVASEADRAARLEALEHQGKQLGEAEAERNDLRAEVSALHRELKSSEADRAARLEVIETQGRRLDEVEASGTSCGQRSTRCTSTWRGVRRTGRRGSRSSRRRGGGWARWRRSGTSNGLNSASCTSTWRGARRTGRRGWRSSRRRGGGWPKWRRSPRRRGGAWWRWTRSGTP